MLRTTVIGGTGYAGSAIVEEASTRGHQVTALSSRGPRAPLAGVDYVQGDATDPEVLASCIRGADVVVSALAPRGRLKGPFRDVTRRIADLADTGRARLFVVGGYYSLRPAPGAARIVDGLSGLPTEVWDEVTAVAAVVIEDLPGASAGLDWVFVSPPLGFGAHVPSAELGSYELGDDVAVEPETGGVISVVDYARGLVDLIDDATHHRAHVNLGNPT